MFYKIGSLNEYSSIQHYFVCHLPFNTMLVKCIQIHMQLQFKNVCCYILFQLCNYSKIYLAILLRMDVKVASSLGLIHTTYYKLTCVCLLRHIQRISVGLHLEGIAGHSTCSSSNLLIKIVINATFPNYSLSSLFAYSIIVIFLTW